MVSINGRVSEGKRRRKRATDDVHNSKKRSAGRRGDQTDSTRGAAPGDDGMLRGRSRRAKGRPTRKRERGGVEGG
jgi:hypothetical protein